MLFVLRLLKLVLQVTPLHPRFSQTVATLYVPIHLSTLAGHLWEEKLSNSKCWSAMLSAMGAGKDDTA
jgi:hypothetical protein